MENQTKLNVYLFQPQYAVERRKENTYWLPYSAGCLWTYANTFPEVQERYQLAELGFKREDPRNIIERMKKQPPAVCGFSCYVWNEKYCLSLAQLVKQNFPDVKIVFGGAQASNRLLDYPFIDSVIIAEGEESFVDFLTAETPKQTYNRQRLTNLEIPSPYLTGIFDKLIAENPNALWSMTFETNRGCPYSCTFCDWGGVTYSKVRRLELDRITKDLEWAIGKPISYIICADANFGIFKERDLEIARILRRVADSSGVEAINLQYAKNSTEIVFQIAQIIGEYSKGVTVSVQSMHDVTLEAIKRKNMDVNKIGNLMELSKQYNVGTYTEVILGLPEETLNSWCEGLCKLLELGQHNSIDMWFAQLLERSEMASPTSIEKYKISRISSSDYFALYNSNDYKDIQEEIELVNGTSTMSLEDIVTGYMYGWLIIQWHISGYSQQVAKTVRYQNVSYKKYYDTLFNMVQQHKIFGNHFKELKSLVTTYLKQGKLDIDETKSHGHNLHSFSYEFLYNNKQAAYDLAIECGEHFINLTESDKFTQKHFLFDKDTKYPLYCRDIVINPQLQDTTDFDFYALRRKNLLKNNITKKEITNAHARTHYSTSR